jgi:hypothetical protein
MFFYIVNFVGLSGCLLFFTSLVGTMMTTAYQLLAHYGEHPLLGYCLLVLLFSVAFDLMSNTHRGARRMETAAVSIPMAGVTTLLAHWYGATDLSHAMLALFLVLVLKVLAFYNLCRSNRPLFNFIEQTPLLCGIAGVVEYFVERTD